jgi:hypothetical protein
MNIFDQCLYKFKQQFGIRDAGLHFFALLFEKIKTVFVAHLDRLFY